MSKKTLTLLIIGAAILIAASTGVYVYSTRNAAVSTQVEVVKEATVSKGTIEISFLGDGIADLPVLKLRFPVSGQLQEIKADVGSKIEKGDVIAKLSDKDYANKVESARISYDLALVKLEKTKQAYASQLSTEKTKLETLKYQMESIYLQYQPMLQIPEAYSLQDITAKKIAYENAKSAYEASAEAYRLIEKGSLDITFDELNVRQAEANLKAAQDALANTLVSAPVDGEVLSISHRPGETVSNTTDFALISNAGKIGVVSQVTELDVSKIEIGMSVVMEFEALQGQTVKGKVTSVSSLPVIDSAGIVTYAVNISPDSAVSTVKDGMSCSVSFILKQKQNIMIIPNTAVKRVDGKQVVEVKDGSGSVTTRTIKTGLTDGVNVEVTEGLKEGEIIIIRSKK